MDKKTLSKEIYKRFNVVKRARNCFLYTKKEIRLTDLYQENGRAILGWDAGDAFTQFKNTLNRGVTGFYQTEDKSRLKKAVSQLFNSQRDLFFFSNKADALKAGLLISPESSSMYKPWQPYNTDWTKIKSIVIEPPFPWTDSIYILAVDSELCTDETSFQQEIQLPFPLQVGITRAIYNLIKAIEVRQEKDWFIYDTVLTKYWTRKGPYLYPKVPEEKYDEFIIHCLDCGVIINPDYNQPSIIPYGADKGVFTPLKNKPFIFQER